MPTNANINGGEGELYGGGGGGRFLAVFDRREANKMTT